ncbi:MAG: hypothetical protein ACREBE_27590, partial [bacterium]
IQAPPAAPVATVAAAPTTPAPTPVVADSTPPAPIVAAPLAAVKPKQLARPDSSKTNAALLVAAKPDSTSTKADTKTPTNVTAADSSPATTPAGGRGRRGLRDGQEIRVLAEQAQEHFKRAADFVRSGDVGKARTEYVQVVPVVGLLRKLSAGTPGAAQVEQALRTSSMQAVQACRAGLADSTTHSRFPPNFRCEQLLPPAVRGQRGQRANNPASRWDR